MKKKEMKKKWKIKMIEKKKNDETYERKEIIKERMLHRGLQLYFVLIMKSHLQSYPCPLEINSFWNLWKLLQRTISTLIGKRMVNLPSTVYSYVYPSVNQCSSWTWVSSYNPRINSTGSRGRLANQWWTIYKSIFGKVVKHLIT